MGLIVEFETTEGILNDRISAFRTPSNLLVVNLAFSDFLMMFTMGPPMIVNCYYETWVLGRMYHNNLETLISQKERFITIFSFSFISSFL